MNYSKRTFVSLQPPCEVVIRRLDGLPLTKGDFSVMATQMMSEVYSNVVVAADAEDQQVQAVCFTKSGPTAEDLYVALNARFRLVNCLSAPEDEPSGSLVN